MSMGGWRVGGGLVIGILVAGSAIAHPGSADRGRCHECHPDATAEGSTTSAEAAVALEAPEAVSEPPPSPPAPVAAEPRIDPAPDPLPPVPPPSAPAEGPTEPQGSLAWIWVLALVGILFGAFGVWRSRRP